VTILTAQEIRDWDLFTIEHEPVSSIDLMERASRKCAEWIMEWYPQTRPFKVFCGKGNNGGDGLAIARMLLEKGYEVASFIIESGSPASSDHQTNLQRLQQFPGASIHFIETEEHFPFLTDKDVVIDALFGSGLNKPVEGFLLSLINYLNRGSAPILSIDLPGGLFSDQSSKGNIVVQADHTLTFQCYKTALLMQENAPFIGQVHVLDIGLHPGYPGIATTENKLITGDFIKTIYRPRNVFSHKGNFGHALVIAGSYGKIGAAVMMAGACLHSGVGLLSCYLPKCGYVIMQSSVPEAMVITDEDENILTQLPQSIEKYSAIGIGPGIGTEDATQKLISFLIRRYHKPLILDADALNCLSLQKELLEQLPEDSVLTPHPKEFDRLFGEHENDFERLRTAKQKAKELGINIVLKSHHTLVATAGGQSYFNNTGNAGMAKGGSGDVLTGIITSFAAQGYAPASAAVFGVYLHGLSGDIAANVSTQETMTPTDIIRFLPEAFRQIRPDVN
jgi:hydroxyethylthiazole kinase-like uncharacterized protein yjeF